MIGNLELKFVYSNRLKKVEVFVSEKDFQEEVRVDIKWEEV